MAPKMTKAEVIKLRSSVRQAHRTYKPVPVMYIPEPAPNGFQSPLVDILAGARAARARAAAAKKKTTERCNPDALPAHLTPANYTRIQVQTRPTTSTQGQQQQQQQQQRPTRPSQSQAQVQLAHRPVRQSYPVATPAASQPQRQSRQSQYITAPVNAAQAQRLSCQPQQEQLHPRLPGQNQQSQSGGGTG
ncbi:hypothetical protein VTK56DRAFT_2273 [Thermocarpiscus australiensis]